MIKYNVPSVEHKCIEAILNCTNDRITPYHLTIYDNYPKNEPLSVIWNRLIKRSEADYICLINSDAYAEPLWLDKMLEVFSKDEKIKLVGPTSNRVGGQQGRIKTADHYEISDIKYICGFCMVFPKSIWQDVGGFEERFKFSSEDNYFTWQIQQLGYRTVVRHDVFVYHDFHASWKEREKITGRHVRANDCKEAEGVFRELTKGKAETPDGRPSNINE